MKLPNCERATVAREKITEYLLSTTHRHGGQKAVFFLRYGFSRDSWADFAVELRRHACIYDVAKVNTTEYGTPYRIEGPINVPNGRRPLVRTVWMIDAGTDAPRLISAYPI
ncbi:MAG: DUF6883 domain-containing protein [Dehalococcoidia bacterium]